MLEYQENEARAAVSGEYLKKGKIWSMISAINRK